MPLSDLRAKTAELLGDVRLGAAMLDRMPAQLSGGERQRVAIARAFAANPDLLICDEITTALDVLVQAAVLERVRDLARKHDVAAIFVSHDLAVVRANSDRIAVLRNGRIVEINTAQALCARPVDPYTKSLLSRQSQARPPRDRSDLLLSPLAAAALKTSAPTVATRPTERCGAV